MCRALKDLEIPQPSTISEAGTLRSERCSIDVLKIDRSLLVNSESGQRSKIIFEGIIEMSNRLDVSVIVEGVETIRQETMLRSYGSHLVIQGCLFEAGYPRSLQRNSMPALLPVEEEPKTV